MKEQTFSLFRGTLALITTIDIGLKEKSVQLLYFYRSDDFSLQGDDGAMGMIKDYSTVSEEELFQESTVYDLPVPMDLLIKLQCIMKEKMNCELYTEQKIKVQW